MVKVEKVFGKVEIENALQELSEKGIRPNEVLSDGKNSYTIVYDDKIILNEG